MKQKSRNLPYKTQNEVLEQILKLSLNSFCLSSVLAGNSD